MWAAIKALGLTPEDFDLGLQLSSVKVSDKIPDVERRKDVEEQRKDVWQGLQEARVNALKELLESFSDTDVRRYERTGKGIRPVEQGDVPPVDSLAGMGDFEEMQARMYKKIQEEQERKATALATNFLQEKKRQDDADAALEALEKRLREYRKARDDAIKQKKKELEKKAQQRAEGAAKAAKARAEWEDETENKIFTKLEQAHKTRTQLYSKENLKEKMEAAEGKRQRAFDQAVEQEQTLLANIEARRMSVEERLENRRREVEEEMRQRAEAMQAKFQERQIRVCATQQEWAENKLKKHMEFTDLVKANNDRQRKGMLQRSHSCKDYTKKSFDKWRQGHDKVMKEYAEFCEHLDDKNRQAHERMEAQAALKLKYGKDIHTHNEEKYGTWGGLQRRRYDELKSYRDAHGQALVFKVAEHNAKIAAQEEGKEEIFKRRQLIAKETLALNDRAKIGFIKIQRESDERKITMYMEELGFKMPKLPEPEVAEQGA